MEGVSKPTSCACQVLARAESIDPDLTSRVMLSAGASGRGPDSHG